MSRQLVTEEKLEKLAEMLEAARAIVAELESGETVETEEDADASIAEAKKLARDFLAIKAEG